LVYECIWTHAEDKQFSPQMFRILNTSVLDICVVCGLMSLNSWLFLWFSICGLVHILFLSLVVSFEFFNSHFSVTTLGLDLRTALFWVIMQQVVVISYWHFRKHYQSHPLGSKIQKKACGPNMEFLQGRVWDVKSSVVQCQPIGLVQLVGMEGMVVVSRVKTERDGTRAETRFGFPAKRTSPFISAGVSVQSSTGFLGVRVGGEWL